MIYGIGTDITEIRRIAALVERFGTAFARRILATSEWTDYEQATQPVRFLAKRFAAKEAFAKAMGTGLRYPATLDRIGVAHDSLGRPFLTLAPPLQQWMQQRGIQQQHLSISDEREFALAFVVLET